MLSLKGTWLVVTSMMIAWPILDGCWRGFLGRSEWRNDALFHSITISAAVALFFLLPTLLRRFKPSPH